MTSPGSGQQLTLRRRSKSLSSSAYVLQALNVSLFGNPVVMMTYIIAGSRRLHVQALLNVDLHHAMHDAAASPTGQPNAL